MKKGRPSKYSAHLCKQICGYIEKGLSFKDASLLSNIAESTFYEWKNQFPEFSESLKKAEIECKAARIATIFKASEKSWQAAAWWLERRFPEEYGREKPQANNVPPVVFGLPLQSQFIQPDKTSKKSVVAALRNS